MRTLCAFANDFENLGGGYVIIGSGLRRRTGDRLLSSRWSAQQPTGQDSTRTSRFLQPDPAAVLPRVEPGKHGWEEPDRALGARRRKTAPYKAPKEVTAKHKTYHYFIRRYSSTIEAKGDDERELLSLTATVPFDDRRCQKADVEALRLPLILAYLKESAAPVWRSAGMPLVELGRQMSIVDGPRVCTAP